MSFKIRQRKGITLIALVVTIILLLILAGVTIATLTGENSILRQATRSKEETEKTQEKEAVSLAVNSARLRDKGYEELTQTNLQNALNNQLGTGKAIVSYNEDGTFTVSFIDSKRDYNITFNGVEDGIDWNEAMANAVAPDNQTETSKNIIGIGTDGNPVNMDLWEYTLLNDGTYGLNDDASLKTEKSANASKGFLGIYYEKINIPQYISVDSGNNWTAVTNLDWTFFNCTELEKIDKVPSTIKSMRYTFRGCNNLYKICNLPMNIENMMCTFFGTAIKDMPNIPEKVTNMYGTFNSCEKLTNISNIPNSVVELSYTFYNCTLLEKSPIIPNSVKMMTNTFMNCISLKEAPIIPNSVENIQAIFYGCTSLKKAPVIPNSVTNIINAFYDCTNLQGTIEINANVKGIAIGSNLDYTNCLLNATTTKGITLKVTGSCPVLTQIISNANNPNITIK